MDSVRIGQEQFGALAVDGAELGMSPEGTTQMIRLWKWPYRSSSVQNSMKVTLLVHSTRTCLD